MLKYSEEFMSKKFTGKNMKDAYMKAVKWYATNVLANDELHGITVEYEKDKQSPTITAHLYATMEEEEVFEAHCNICKEFRSSFFINSDSDCSKCTAKGYHNRCKERIKPKVNWCRVSVGIKERGYE